MDSLPKPEVLEKHLAAAEASIREIRRLYRTAEPNAFARPKHGGGDGGRSQSRRCSRCRGDGRVGEDRMPCPDCDGEGSVPTSEDSVGDTVLATERYRRLVRHAAREAVDGANRFGGAAADLNDALKLLDPQPGPEVADIRQIPRTASRLDRARAQVAQMRRQGRAERSGDWSEIG